MHTYATSYNMLEISTSSCSGIVFEADSSSNLTQQKTRKYFRWLVPGPVSSESPLAPNAALLGQVVYFLV